MRIGVDATCWHNRRGYGRHSRALLRALVRLDQSNTYTLFLDSDELAEPTPEGCELRLLRAGVPTVQAASAQGRRSVRDMWRMSRALSRPEFQVLLFPTVYSYVPAFSRARKLVMVHDVIAETYPKLTVPRTSARLLWNTKVALGIAQAHALITVSDYSREGIVKHFGVDAKKIFVVGEAADPVFRKLANAVLTPKLRAAGIVEHRRMVVYVGGFSPHKNLDMLVSAFARVARRPEFADVLLVMVGATTGDAFLTYFHSVEAQVATLGLSDRVVFTGYLADEDLVVLLNLAAVLILPSLMEGFGLPAVEAAQCGCPVIATTSSPLRGLLGEGGQFIKPSEAEIERSLTEVLSSRDLRRRMGAHGQEAAARLTWDRAALQMMRIIEDVQTCGR